MERPAWLGAVFAGTCAAMVGFGMGRLSLAGDPAEPSQSSQRAAAAAAGGPAKPSQAARDGLRAPLKMQRRRRIVLLGDSITQYGWAGVKEGNALGWAAQLAHAYARRADVINRGYSGFNTRMIRPVARCGSGPGA